jgi:uncharacterized membrane protein
MAYYLVEGNASTVTLLLQSSIIMVHGAFVSGIKWLRIMAVIVVLQLSRSHEAHIFDVLPALVVNQNFDKLNIGW